MTTTTQLVSGKDAYLDLTPGAITAPQETIDELRRHTQRLRKHRSERENKQRSPKQNTGGFML